MQSADNQDKHFSREVVKRLCKQCMNGQETAHTVCSSVTEDFNCLNLFVVKLFIKRLQTTSVTQIFDFLRFFLSVFNINDINSCKIIIQLCMNPE